ncbi:hypothetical protein QIS99_29640 [Streptomyces sp. B-S-A8]|uniref:Uncharacterized protein n=1 Tax=Streptomyces solicavernae TaxID=3043614 RepID=A0ABT6S2T0_9ACTN|nr:hypothetical protein [Streptomyces sp. B-S-A8]MDI3390323.1 hypothetical protein [Streptomyces sp. B-S-A8]
MRRTRGIGPFRLGTGHNRSSVVDGSLSRDRFVVDVAEGLMGVGVPFRRGCSALGFRVTVTDTETGRRQYVSENYTHDLAYADGERYVTKLVTGRKSVK